jgi:hypothetical protein
LGFFFVSSLGGAAIHANEHNAAESDESSFQYHSRRRKRKATGTVQIALTPHTKR